MKFPYVVVQIEVQIAKNLQGSTKNKFLFPKSKVSQKWNYLIRMLMDQILQIPEAIIKTLNDSIYNSMFCGRCKFAYMFG